MYTYVFILIIHSVLRFLRHSIVTQINADKFSESNLIYTATSHAVDPDVGGQSISSYFTSCFIYSFPSFSRVISSTDVSRLTVYRLEYIFLTLSNQKHHYFPFHRLALLVLQTISFYLTFHNYNVIMDNYIIQKNMLLLAVPLSPS